MDHDFQRKTGRSALPASFSSFDQMPLISRPTRARNTRDARSLLEEEVTEETRARPLFDARTFLEIEAQEETGMTPKSGTEETEEDWGFEQITNEEPVATDVKTESGEPQPDIEQLTNGPFVPVVKTEPGEPHPAAVADAAPAELAVVSPDVQAVIDLVDRLQDRGLLVHAGAAPQLVDVAYTSSKKDRSTANVVWRNEYKDVDLRQFAFFATVVEPTNGFDSKRLSWRLGPQNAFSNFTLDRTGQTNYDFKSMFNLKLTLPPQRTIFDPNGKYSVSNTITFLRQVDLDTQLHAAKACSTIVSEYNRLHKNTDVMFKDYVDLARAGDKVLQEGAISPPHANVLHAFCNTPHFSTSVYASKCPCSGWLQLRRRTQPCCGSWQGRFAIHRSVP